MFRIGVAVLCACLLLAAPAAAQTNPGQQGALKYLEQQVPAQNAVLADQARAQKAADAVARQNRWAKGVVQVGCGRVLTVIVENQIAPSLGPLGYSGLTFPLSATTCALLTAGVNTWIDAQSTVAGVNADLLRQIETGVQTLTTKANTLGAQIATGLAVSSSAAAGARRSGRTLRVRGRAGARLRHIRVTFKGRTLHDRPARSAAVRIPTAGLRPGGHRVTIAARDHRGRRWARRHWIYVPVPRG